MCLSLNFLCWWISENYSKRFENTSSVHQPGDPLLWKTVRLNLMRGTYSEHSHPPFQILMTAIRQKFWHLSSASMLFLGRIVYGSHCPWGQCVMGNSVGVRTLRVESVFIQVCAEMSGSGVKVKWKRFLVSVNTKLQIVKHAKNGESIAKIPSKFNIGNQTVRDIPPILALSNF